MLCTQCNYRGEMKNRRGEYEYQSLPGTVLHNVEFRQCPTCGAEAVAIPAIEQLDESLASEVVRKTATLTPEEFRFLRKYLGWSGRDTAKRMGVEPETISRWEHERGLAGRYSTRVNDQYRLVFRFTNGDAAHVIHLLLRFPALLYRWRTDGPFVRQAKLGRGGSHVALHHRNLE